MAEYIKREEVLAAVERWELIFAPSATHRLIDLVKIIPAADVVERNPGKWMTTNAFPHHVYCSSCHMTYIPNDKWQVWRDQYGDGGLPRDFCPNCGADMRGESDD